MFYTNKPFMLLTLSSLMISTIMALSSTNWLFLWMAMEINMLSFIPLMSNSKTNQETEASIKYFMAQALGSSLMLMTSMAHWSSSTIPFMNLILMSAILLKLGMAPFHFWFPSVMTSMSWLTCMILATWQKLAPLIILSFILHNSSTMYIMIIAAINALLGGMMGMNQSHLRTIMAYSSITHMGWMTSMLYSLKPYMTITYYIMYSLIIIPLFIIIHYNNQQNTNQFNKVNTMSPIIQILIPIMLLSLSGMPPFTGFIPKWLAIYTLCQTSPHILMIMILGAMMNMYFYMNILFNSLLSMNLSTMNMSMNKMNVKMPTILATLSISLLPLFMM